jgi:hypothetical protein
MKMADVEKFKTSVNDVTGDLIKSKASSQKAYADNWERIFGKKQEEHPHSNSGVRFSGMMLPEPVAVFEEEHVATPFMEELLPQGMIEDNI